MSKMPSKRDSGFTMMELVMTMAIVVILGTIAIPGFKFVTSSNRISTEVNGLLGDIQLARSQAVKEGLPVTICTSSSPYTGCTNTDWQLGWIVFLDTNGNKAVEAGEVVIRTQPAFGGTDTFAATPSTFHALTFNRMGYAPTGVANAVNITLHDSTSNTSWTRCVAINPIGSTVTEKFGDGTPSCN
ncbi:MAG TPA: GspH/FimT family pseudopilin [Steroidobacteraceae bacterium]|jgi:type IV fimbrial biogenesis protein FimT|nr:GspH/FimT family pseudopilin [Steroidobacteraceae bacterium]